MSIVKSFDKKSMGMNQSKPKLNLKKKFLSRTNDQGKSLLEKIINNQPENQKQNQLAGRIVITKLNDYVEDKCLYGKNCAHLRSLSKCQFLHQKKDFQALSLQLPQKYLENEQPLKKSKQQRKQDKIKQRADREQRLQYKLNRQKRQQQEQVQKQFEKSLKKPVQQKVLDKRELLIQKLLETQNEVPLTLGHIYQQLNLLSEACCLKTKNKYSQEYDILSLKMSVHDIRRRLFLKLNKNKQFQIIHKQFIQKEGSIIKKLIKNILQKYQQEIQTISQGQKDQSLDLRQIYQQNLMALKDIQKIMRSKKDHQAIILYYQRLFDQQFGFPISFDIETTQDNQHSTNNGNYLPLKEFHLLTIIASNIEFSRKFISLNITYAELRALSQFSSLMIAQKVQNKAPVQKTITVDIMNTNYSKFVQQITTQYLSDYHQKMKPAGEFPFGKMQQNLKKYRAFLIKYYAKIMSESVQNTFTLVVFGLKQLLDSIVQLDLIDNLSYQSIKKDRSINQENLYQKIFLLRQFIAIFGQKTTYANSRLKVVYVDNGKKLKIPKFQAIIETIDPQMKQEIQIKNQQTQVKVQKMEAQ